MIWTDEQLIYSATKRCACGAGLAYAPDDPGDPALPFKGPSAWDCSDILTGRAIEAGHEGAKTHTDKLPFSFYEIKDERQPSANGATTRPSGIPRLFDPPKPRPKFRVFEDAAGDPPKPRPKFRVFEDAAGEWRFTLVSANGEPIATSEGYTRKADAERGIEALVEAARTAEVV